jgi:hypothetical protein
MLKLVEWSPELDLTKFYKEAEILKHYNNSSQKILIDSLRVEKEWNVWILYWYDNPVGSVGAHSFDTVMGNDSYRIAVRTCVFTDSLPLKSIRTYNQIITHQNITAQFLIPKCLEWVPRGSKTFITSNESAVGTQKAVHNIWCPAMEKIGVMKNIGKVYYRNTHQTVWQLYKEKFFQSLAQNKKWNLNLV